MSTKPIPGRGYNLPSNNLGSVTFRCNDCGKNQATPGRKLVQRHGIATWVCVFCVDAKAK